MFWFLLGLKKEVLAIEEGQRESTLSWATLLLDLKAQGCGSVKATMAMVYKLAIEAEKTWVRLRGYRLIPLVVDGVPFVNGERKLAA